ncbi:MAG TPA: threonine--tRNA ligase [Bryobacteraceae bacterium]|nr:threonine--tRNA ligase [Bryobacteraceae bacterium]
MAQRRGPPHKGIRSEPYATLKDQNSEMESITVTLPDGSRQTFPPGTRPLDVAQAVSPRLAKEAVVARVNGELWDLTRPLEGDATVEILTPKDPEALEVYRHSTAHLLAAAVLELFPGTKLGIGPPIENGFYYDFLRDKPFTPEDLEKIEAKMWELQAQDLPYERRLVPKEEGLKKYAEMGEHMKCELIQERAGEVFSEYTLGPHFIDFCRGPHVPSTSYIKAFKLLSIAGAYWKGDEKNHQLQRIYGTAFFTRKELEDYLRRLEEAKKRDHRKLGKELDLFSIQELAGPGLIFFHPKGAMVRKLLEDWMREQYLARGYSLVYTPHVARAELWKTSGHYSFYAENMFRRMELDDAEYQLKPMNCPFHILIYKDRIRSYRDLPVRLGELGTVYRYERSGVMHGLLRVRGFTQDDAHIFCRPDQIEDEITGCLQFAVDVLRTFGFDEYEAELSTWDGGKSAKYDGTPEQWELAERALSNAAARLNLKVKVIPDEAAFYGPKIDVKLVDAIGRLWQLSTVQFDFTLPRRFELEYIGEDGKAHQPLMVHRALYGSVERFFGILLEHYAGAFPVWLAPVQAVVLPIADRHIAYARQVTERLKAAGIRAELDDRNEKVNLKIREAQLQKVPYMLVAGDREVQNGTVSVRNRRRGDLGPKSVEEFLAEIRHLIESKAPVE